MISYCLLVLSENDALIATLHSDSKVCFTTKRLGFLRAFFWGEGQIDPPFLFQEELV